MKKIIFIAATMLALIACRSLVVMEARKMNQLELGMSKAEVVKILGKGYKIAEKRTEQGKQIEVLSYRDDMAIDEFYLFQFEDNRLKEWRRELLPRLKE